MTERNNYPHDPWERDSYETGSTKPPKSRGGIVAILLIAVIFLGGICSVLGIMNIRLFRQLNHSGNSAGTNFFASSASEESTADSQKATEFTPNSADVTVELNKAPEGIDNIPQQGGLSYQAIYDKAISSVVSISCDTGTGTGVVLSADGYIVTNCHVVEGAKTIQVVFTDQQVLPATVIGADAVSDLAVLFVQAQGLSPAEFGDSSTLRVGDAVAAIGDPLGLEFRGTMTDGIVSAINRDVTTEGRTMTLIQTNAALNSGNSGGPLLNCYGQVIGINTMKIGAFTDSAGVEGLGFAIPSTTVKQIVDQLISQGYVSGRPDPGFVGQTISSIEQAWYRLPAGVLITQITPDGSAAQAGLQEGDIVLSIDGTRVTDREALENLLFAHQSGDRVALVIYRGGKQYSTTLTLGEANG